ncbi:MAG: recombinase family protein [Colwellia sp.]|uniref:recombinase family protein n=1 Tax=Alteromonadales TaxID=135622 RepID=UPI001D2646C4|nr:MULTISPECIES: recombinase family protein [Alteromonadales]NQZ27985.1 recombinase family protein [Colwellia sp.]NRA81383.1 recombinase family protein [Pseudoalteromonas sp.]
MKCIYARTSTEEQNVEQQVAELKKHYGDTDMVFTDKRSGKDMDRPAFNSMVDNLKSGDTVICYDISRLGRKVQHVLDFADYCKDNGIKLFIHALGGVDVTSSSGKMILTTLAGVAEMMRVEMLEKQRIGIATAKADGKYTGRKQSPETVRKFKEVNELIEAGKSASRALELIGLSRGQFYKMKKAGS